LTFPESQGLPPDGLGGSDRVLSSRAFADVATTEIGGRSWSSSPTARSRRQRACTDPLVAEGAGVLARFTDRELSLLRDYLLVATELTERHRKRIADGAKH
jgi:hypothetical protein